MGKLGDSLAIAFRYLQSLGWQWWLASLLVGLLVGFAVFRMGSRAGRAVAAGTLGAYVVLVLALTVLSRSQRAGAAEVGVGIVATWASRLANEGGMRYELTANALMLLPVGFLLPVATGWGFKRSMCACTAFTVSIEAAQLLTARGVPESSDVVLNVLGALAGYGLYAVARPLASRCRPAFGWNLR